MAKRMKPKGKSRSGGGSPDQAAMMNQFQKMQEDMIKAQEALEHETLAVTAGGGAITVTITGHQRVQSITIDPEIIDTDEDDWLEDLQDLLTAAVNQAIEQSQALSAERMEGITGGLPGGLGGLLG